MKKLFIIPALIGAMFFTSCEDFLDVNVTKDSPITTTVDQVLPVACFYASQLCYDHAEYGVYLSQALTTGGKSQTGSYPYSQGWEFLGVNRHPMWRRHFYDLGANINMMYTIAGYKLNAQTKEYEIDWNANPKCNAVLIARTIMLASTLFTTDAFGAMPRSEVYQSTSPAYDTQESIYEWMFKEADALVKLYDDPQWTECPTNLPINETMDRIYGGDLNKWKLYCKAIRARLWLRKLPNWDNTPATCKALIDMVDDVINDPNWEEPRYNYPGTGATESNCPWGPAAPIINSWESRNNRLATSIPTKFFMYGILGAVGSVAISEDDTNTPKRGYVLDPRAAQMMEKRTYKYKNAKGIEKTVDMYGHLESNIGKEASMKTTYYPDLFAEKTGTNPFTKNDGYIALITHEELLFIKAEAQYWNNQKQEAYQTTVEATKYNMQRYGLNEAEIINDYTKDDKGNTVPSSRNWQYKRFWKIKFEQRQADWNIADIMQQKYVAMYLQPEQWTDLRRYNYSSSSNGIQYNGVFVYNVLGTHNGNGTAEDPEKEPSKPGRPRPRYYEDSLGVNWDAEYALRRPYNLYEAYWCKPEDEGKGVELSPNAWINRLNADTETETKYNKEQLWINGYYQTDANGNAILDAQGNKILDYRILKKRMIWAKKGGGNVTCVDPTPWM